MQYGTAEAQLVTYATAPAVQSGQYVQQPAVYMSPRRVCGASDDSSTAAAGQYVRYAVEQPAAPYIDPEGQPVQYVTAKGS